MSIVINGHNSIIMDTILKANKGVSDNNIIRNKLSKLTWFWNNRKVKHKRKKFVILKSINAYQILTNIAENDMIEINMIMILGTYESLVNFDM